MKETILQGGTLGDVRLITDVNGTYVRKVQKQWQHPGDPDSWRREHDLFAAGFEELFTDELRPPVCYQTSIEEGKMELKMEYVEGVSGAALTLDMLEAVAEAWGECQGRLRGASFPPCLSNPAFIEREFAQWSPDTWEYKALRAADCDLPLHLRDMLIDTQARSGEIFAQIRVLPLVFCHRDLWIENIIVTKNGIRLIDWDGAGRGYPCEDIASLIADGMPGDPIGMYAERLVPAYRRGLSAHMDLSNAPSLHVRDMILIKFGYRFFQAGNAEALQAIYEMEETV